MKIDFYSGFNALFGTIFNTYLKEIMNWTIHLNNYFDFHVCPSIRLPCVRNLTPLSVVLSQNVTNKSCLVCVKSEKYASWVTLRPQWNHCRRGEAEVRILDFKTTWSEFHHLPRVGPKQLCALAHLGSTRTAETS